MRRGARRAPFFFHTSLDVDRRGAPSAAKLHPRTMTICARKLDSRARSGRHPFEELTNHRRRLWIPVSAFLLNSRLVCVTRDLPQQNKQRCITAANVTAQERRWSCSDDSLSSRWSDRSLRAAAFALPSPRSTGSPRASEDDNGDGYFYSNRNGCALQQRGDELACADYVVDMYEELRKKEVRHSLESNDRLSCPARFANR